MQNKKNKKVNILINFLFIFIIILHCFILVIINKVLCTYIKHKKRIYYLQNVFFFDFLILLRNPDF